jgi:hypothetical protein
VTTFSGISAEPSITRPRLPRTPQELDEAIGQERAVRPPTVDTQRAVPRMSVAELNAADLDDLRERFLKSRYDDRGPVTKALDLIDAPRNAIANVIFPGAADAAADQGERAAFGMPRVNFSDALKSLGVENRVARGIVGFVGDVALDPLSYLGPAGWGVKATTRGGKSIAIRGAGARAIKKSVRDVSLGRSARDATVGEYLKSAGLLDEAATMRASGKGAREIENALRVRVMGDPADGFVARQFSRVGGDRGTTGGGLITDVFRSDLSDPALKARTDAASAVLRRYGKGTEPGLRVRGGGSQVAHIPFTDYGIQVPAFTRGAKSGLAVQRLARDADRVDALAALGPAGGAAKAAVDRMRGLVDTEEAAIDAHVEAVRRLEEAKGTAVAAPELDAELTRLTDDRLVEIEQRAMEAASLRDEVRGHLAALGGADPKTYSPRALLALSDLVDETEALSARLFIKADKYRESSKTYKAIQGDISDELKSVSATMERLLEEQETVKRGGKTSREVVTPGREYAGDGEDVFIPPEEIGPIGKRDRARRIRDLQDRLDTLEEGNPFRDEIEEEIRLLRRRDALSDERGYSIKGDGAEQGSRYAYLLSDAAGNAIFNADPRVQAQVLEAIRPILDEIEEAGDVLKTAITPDQSLFNQGPPVGSLAPEADAAAGRLADLRARLYEATAPLRDTRSAQTVEQFQESVRRRAVERLNQRQQRLLQIAERDPVAVDRLHEMYQTAFESAKDLATAYKAQIRSMLDSDERDALELVKMVLGTSDDIQGASAIGRMGRMTERMFGSDHPATRWLMRADDIMSRTFGFPTGATQRDLSRAKAGLTTAAHQTAADIKRAVAADIQQLLIDTKLPLTAQDTLAQLVQAYLYMARGGNAVYPLRHLDGSLTPLGEAIMNIAKGGTLDAAAAAPTFVLSGEWANARKLGLFQRARALAEKYGQEIARLGDAELADDLIDNPLQGYVPNAMTDQARRSVRSAQRNPNFTAQGPGVPGQREAFQKPRSTWVFEFIDPATGEAARFYKFDLPVLDIGERAMRAMDPEKRAEVQAMQDLIRRYMALPEKPPPRPMTAFEANKLAQVDGRFPMLLGLVDRPKEMFETSIMATIAARWGQHERAVARQNLMRIVMANGYRVPWTELEKVVTTGGKEFTLPSGLRGSILRTHESGIPRDYIILNGERYRYVDKEVATRLDNPMVATFGESLKDLVVPDVLARRIEDISKVVEPTEVAPLLRVAEKVTQEWKSLALLHPSWTVFNTVGNLVLALSGPNGVNPATLTRQMGRNFRSTVRLLTHKGNPSVLRTLSFDVGGRAIDGETMLQMLREHRIIGTNLAAEHGLRLYDGRLLRPASLPAVDTAVSGPLTRGRLRPRAAAEDLSTDWRFFFDSWRGEEGAGKARAGAAATGVVARDRYMRWLVSPWFRSNQAAEESVRAAVFMAHLDDGNDAAEAARRTIYSMFDYTDLTHVEERYFRTLFPFYAWTKNNLALQLKLLGERPGVAAIAPKLQVAMDEALSGEQNAPMHMRPRWMREALAVNIGTDPNHRWALMLGNVLPMAEVARPLAALTGGEGIEEALHYFGSQTNPLLSIPYQIGSGHEFFSGRSIGTPGEADIGRLEFLGKQVRPANEIGRIADLVGQGSVGGAASRLVLGGRVQAADDERLRSSRLVEFKKQEENLRRAVRRAERGGGDSMESRVKLMLLYAEMERAGFAEDVPAWARRQNAEMVSAPGP